MTQSTRDIFRKLKSHRQAQGQQPILDLFAANPSRAQDFCAKADGLVFDWSKTMIDDHARQLLLELAAPVAAKREAMFAGQPINQTENRAVLHTALRNLDADLWLDGVNIMDGVRATHARMAAFAQDLRGHGFQGQGGAITDVINIGIGGSDLGPAMAVRALAPYHDGPRVHFVSNVDGADIADTLRGLDPTRTLVIVASKTFTTIETMTNAATARDWMARQVKHPERQFVALSSALDLTQDWGIDPERVFGFEDWVGGRYSVWGPIGLSLMLAIGPEQFDRFLAGAAALDRHFRHAPEAENLPILLALVGIWHHQICGYATRAVLPYDNRLARLPAYLQQLEMESNGKSVAVDGADLPFVSGPVVWGEPGTNGQHAFYQLIHQGTAIVPCDFIVAAQGHEPDLAHHHQLLLANCLAQSEALMQGRSLSEALTLMQAAGLTGAEAERQARHRVFSGSRPSTTLLIGQLDPFSLGQIIALYEHRVFVEGMILGINSFDQWGVELGKQLAMQVQPLLMGQDVAGHDPSTLHLAALIRQMRGD